MSPRKALELLATICSVLCALGAALLVAAAWPTPAGAQPAAPASAASASDPVTYGSKCGEYAVGRSVRDGRVIMGAYPGQHVDAAGFWVYCPREQRPEKPKLCNGSVSRITWTVDGSVCSAPGWQPLQAGQRRYVTSDDRRMRGLLRLVCGADGVLQIDPLTCTTR